MTQKKKSLAGTRLMTGKTKSNSKLPHNEIPVNDEYFCTGCFRRFKADSIFYDKKQNAFLCTQCLAEIDERERLQNGI